MTTNPLGLPAAQAKKMYVHEGTEGARVDLVGSFGDISWFPNSGSMQAPSIPPLSKPEAVGLVDFTAKRGAKERAALFQSCLLPAPQIVLLETQAHLEKYLPLDDLKGVMDVLTKKGWQSAESIYADRGKQCKSEWCRITGRRQYGVKIAADWQPDGWLADMDLMTPQQAEALVTDARDALAALHRVQAVSETEAKIAQDANAVIPKLERQQDELETERLALIHQRDKIPTAAAELKFHQLDNEIADLRESANNVQHCPHCQCELVVIDGQIRNPSQLLNYKAEITLAEEERAKAFDELAAHLADVEPYKKQIHELNTRLINVGNQLRGSRQNAKIAGTVVGESYKHDLAEAEADLEEAKTVVGLVTAATKASVLHDTISRYSAVVKALGPQGVRAKMLDAGMTRLNAGLEVLADTAAWPKVQITNGGDISVNERFVALCSESERWRAQASIQLTLAALTKSSVVVLDRADMLDVEARKGLGKALERVTSKTGVAAIVCTTNTHGASLEANSQKVPMIGGSTA